MKSLKIYEVFNDANEDPSYKSLIDNDDEKIDYFMIPPEVCFPPSFMQLLISSGKLLIYKYPDFLDLWGLMYWMRGKS